MENGHITSPGRVCLIPSLHTPWGRRQRHSWAAVALTEAKPLDLSDTGHPWLPQGEGIALVLGHTALSYRDVALSAPAPTPVGMQAV